MWKKSTIYLHWASALCIIALIIAVKSTHDLKLAEKISAIQTHAILGVTVTVFTIMRIYLKIKNRKTNPKSNIVATAFHLGMYLLLAVIGTSGIVFGLQSGMFEFLFNDGGKPVRVFAGYIHHTVAGFIIPVILLHLLATIFHLFKKGDHTFSRMLGKNVSNTELQ